VNKAPVIGTRAQSSTELQPALNMLIEEEADAVFNEEMRNTGKKITKNNENDVAFNERRKENISIPMITLNVNVLNTPEEYHEDKTDTPLGSPAEHTEPEAEGEDSGVESVELEEPVSPPSCHPDEAPLLYSHSLIEDLADVIVKEKRQEEQEEEKDTKPAVRGVPALIPLTVSEFGELPVNPTPTSLHMSGGGVYTTDSYYSQPHCERKKATQVRPVQTSVIKKLPLPYVSTPSSPKNKSTPTQDKKTNDDVLWKFYKQSGLISEAKKTIKLSDGLEITPIVSVPAVNSVRPTKKRSHELPETDTQPSKKSRSDLVIEKIPKKKTEDKPSEQRDLTSNEQTLDCKLVISNIFKQAKLVFENGTEVPLSKNILRHINPFTKQPLAQSKRIRRKPIRTRRTSNHSKVESNLDSAANIVKDEELSGNPEPVVVEMPQITDKDSAKTGIPQSSDCDDTSKLLVVPGQHKLPSIVTQPSYHSGAKRKIAVKSK